MLRIARMADAETHFMVAEGDFVFTASEGMIWATLTAYDDVFRVEDGEIVEHWDVLQERLKHSENPNGMF